MHAAIDLLLSVNTGGKEKNPYAMDNRALNTPTDPSPQNEHQARSLTTRTAWDAVLDAITGPATQWLLSLSHIPGPDPPDPDNLTSTATSQDSR